MPAYVPALGVGMMIHGAVLGAIGAYLVFLFGNLTFTSLRDVGGLGGEVGTIGGMGSAVGIATAFAGGLQVYTGFFVRRFQKRTLAFFGLVAGLVSFFNCYCLPTAVGLLVLGSVVMVNRDVRDAFMVNEGGQSLDVVLDEFMPADHQRRGWLAIGIAVGSVTLVLLALVLLLVAWVASLGINW